MLKILGGEDTKWKLMPFPPTEEMLNNGIRWLQNDPNAFDSLSMAYAAMMAAVPPSPVCKGKNCTAIHGVGQSDECVAEHTARYATPPAPEAISMEPVAAVQPHYGLVAMQDLQIWDHLYSAEQLAHLQAKCERLQGERAELLRALKLILGEEQYGVIMLGDYHEFLVHAKAVIAKIEAQQAERKES